MSDTGDKEEKNVPILQQKVHQLKIFTVPIKNELTKTGGLLIEAFITFCSISFKCKFEILSLSQWKVETEHERWFTNDAIMWQTIRLNIRYHIYWKY